MALHQRTLAKGVVDLSDPRCLEALTPLDEMNGTYPSSSSSMNILRLAHVLAPTYTENPDHANAAVSQHCESAKEQYQSGKTGLDALVAFVDDYP